MKSSLATFILLALSATAYADSPHCISETKNSSLVTQCDDGTVTIVNSSNGSYSVCKTIGSEMVCKEGRL